jgi:2-polyprenyl-6-methoxyphenol hydroxylase-like FAD-dependent oxidoreductase
MHTYDTDVLVVGAGPTGLMAANGLRRLGVPCRIIERKSGPTEHSQALAVHARSLEIMDLLGIAEAFIRRGYTAPGLNLSGDSREPVDVELYRLDTRFPYILILPQGETEEILEQHLQSLAGQVERNLTLQKIHQEDDGVTAEIRGADGKEQTIQARYLIDCEGAHSVIRHGLNVPAISGKYQGVAFLADVKVEGELAKGYVSNYSHESSEEQLTTLLATWIKAPALNKEDQKAVRLHPVESSGGAG